MKHKLPERKNYSFLEVKAYTEKAQCQGKQGDPFFYEILPCDAIGAIGISQRFESEDLSLHNLKQILLFYPIQF